MMISKEISASPDSAQWQSVDTPVHARGTYCYNSMRS